jgi:hypothetical protein
MIPRKMIKKPAPIPRKNYLLNHRFYAHLEL